LPRDVVYYLVAPHDSGKKTRQDVLTSRLRFQRSARGRIDEAYRGDERVPSTGDIDDVAALLVPVAEDLPKGSHMDTQVAVFHEGVWPCVFYEFVFANHFAGAFGESNQQV
jgi:hypothetical protein